MSFEGKTGQIERYYAPTKWGETAAELQQAYAGGEEARLQMARSLAQKIFDHPDCQKANTRPDQRSFFLEHGRITPKSFLLVHGFTASPYEMRELGQVLFDQGCNVTGVRLSGHGTNTEDFARYGALDWKNDVRSGLAIASLIGEKVLVIGESMGGCLSSILTANFPEFVHQLILCAPCFRLVNRIAPLADFKLVRRILPTNNMGLQFEWQRDYWYEIIPTSSIVQLLKVIREARTVGPKITSPTLVIQAENDLVAHPRGSVRFFQTLSQLKPAQKKLILFLNGHHNLTVDLNPLKEQVFRWVREFIGD